MPDSGDSAGVTAAVANGAEKTSNEIPSSVPTKPSSPKVKPNFRKNHYLVYSSNVLRRSQKFDPSNTFFLTFCILSSVKLWMIGQIFVAFLEYQNFNNF